MIKIIFKKKQLIWGLLTILVGYSNIIMVGNMVVDRQTWCWRRKPEPFHINLQVKGGRDREKDTERNRDTETWPGAGFMNPIAYFNDALPP